MKQLLVLFFILFIGCDSTTKKLPVLSYAINDSGEKIMYTITYEGFTNQSGDEFTTESIENKVCLANFFFTRCPSICPPMRTQLIAVSNTFANESDFMIMSHTIDPEHDSISVLNDYAKSTGISNERWQFLRASEAKTKAQAKQYMTNFKPYADGTDFYHSSYVALVDKDQYIRGFYNTLVPEDVHRLKEDIQLLLD